MSIAMLACGVDSKRDAAAEASAEKAVEGSAEVASGDSSGGADGSPRSGSKIRTERLARIAEELAAHRAAIVEQGIGSRLNESCEALLASDFDGHYFPRGEFGVARGDVQFQAIWNRVSPRTSKPRALDFEQHPDQIDTFTHIARELRKHDIEFLAVPIPRVGQIYPERLVDSLEVPANFVGADPGVAAFLAELVEREVEVLHLTPHFAAEREVTDDRLDRFLFHDWNAHWTPRAVTLTADRIASRVRTMEGFQAGSLGQGKDWRSERKQFTHDVPTPRDMKGAIETEVWVDQILNEAGEPAHRPSQAHPILFLGDSNSQWYKKYGADIASQLCARLEQHLDVIAMQGAAADAWWKTLARREGAGSLAGKRIVIWVFEARMLTDKKLVPPKLYFD